MKLILIVLFLIFFLANAFSQKENVIYRPVFINQCNQEVEAVFWWLHNNTSTYNLNADHFNQNKVILSDTGKYFLLTESDLVLPLTQLHFDSFGVFRDTFYTEKTSLSIHVSTPPFSEYFGCDSLAEGFITDYYYNGNLRLEGNFKQGQPVDTLREYNRSGILKEQYISTPKNKKRLTCYYPNGQIENDYLYFKKTSKSYYASGQLKSSCNYSKLNKKEQVYYPNGQLKQNETKKKQLKFNKKGQLIEQKIRRLSSSFFSTIKWFHQYKWYRYEWSFYDPLGKPYLKIFHGENQAFDYEFLDSIQQLESAIHKIYFYQNNRVYQKIELDYIKEDNQYKKYFIFYKKENKHWIEVAKLSIEQVYQKLEQHLDA